MKTVLPLFLAILFLAAPTMATPSSVTVGDPQNPGALAGAIQSAYEGGALRDNGDGTTTVTLDENYGVPADAKMSNPMADGPGYKIIDCRLGDTRSRGMLLKGDNGLVENNVVDGCGQAAVSLGPEYYWGEADYVHHIIVQGNTLANNGLAFYGGGAVFVHGDGAIGNEDIVVRNNRFISNYF